MAGNLVPVKRPDRNGRLVTRWVSPDGSPATSNKLLGATPQAVTAKSQETPTEAFKKTLNKIKEDNPKVIIHLQVSKDDYSVLNLISIPKEQRKTGYGTRIMQQIVDAADKEGIDLALTPSDHFGSSKARLDRFYRRFGFIPNKGRSKDYRTRETMLRPAAE